MDLERLVVLVDAATEFAIQADSTLKTVPRSVMQAEVDEELGVRALIFRGGCRD